LRTFGLNSLEELPQIERIEIGQQLSMEQLENQTAAEEK
jgi:hypothetical protein